MARRMLSAVALALGLLLGVTAGAAAHHGWSWTTGGNIDVTGIVKTISLGNPHGVVELDVEGETWTVEVGQPWRNERAGLKEGELKPGIEMRVIGEPSADVSEKRVKAERFYLGDREFILYPGRD